jgi:N-glycosylase/DNA lyase
MDTPLMAEPSSTEVRSSAVVFESHGADALTVDWGLPFHIGSPAYWVELTRYAVEDGVFGSDRPHRLGETVLEEAVACLLGGYGITYEMGLAAFKRVRASGALECGVVSEEDLVSLLLEPLDVGARVARYRFPHQRGHRIAKALQALRRMDLPADPFAARQALLSIPGIGYKTASWIVRNQFDSDEVAIIDIHVWRAARRACVFLPSWNPQTHYLLMEAAFKEWARLGTVPARHLDAVIWSQQARLARRR